MFLEKAITKKINLLYYADLFGPNIVVRDLINFLAISQNTIKKYIQEINETVDDFQINYTDNSINVPLNQKKTASLVARELLEESLNLKIFYRIFKYEYSLNELANDLFLSKSAVLRKIKAINCYFDEHHLPIKIENNQHYQIMGDEKIIRNFLQIIFFETHNYDLLKTYKIINLEARRFIEKHFSTDQSFYQSLAVETNLVVAIIRSAQGHLLFQSLAEIPTVLQKDICLIYDYFIQKIPVVAYIEQTFRVNYTRLYTANIIDTALLETYHFYRENTVNNKADYYKYEQLLEMYLVNVKIELSIAEKKEFLLFLMKKKHLQGHFNQVFLKDFEAHFYYLKKVSPEKINFIWNLINELELFTTSEVSIIYEFIIYFVLHTKKIRKNFFQTFEATTKKILIYSSKQASVAEMLGLYIQDKYLDKISLQIEYLTTIYEQIKIEQYDVILSDVYLESFKDKYLYLAMIPNEAFWIEFEERLKKRKLNVSK